MTHLKVFTASWCAPCKAMEPYLQKLAVKVIKVDIDKERKLTAAFDIRAVPTFKLIDDDDNVLRTATGAMTLAKLQDFVQL